MGIICELERGSKKYLLDGTINGIVSHCGRSTLFSATIFLKIKEKY
jgi:hypothetical protein